MKFTPLLLSLSLLASAGASASQALAAEENKPSQTITRAGTQASIKDQPNTLPAMSVSILCLLPMILHRSLERMSPQTRRQIRLAYSPDRPVSDEQYRPDSAH